MPPVLMVDHFGYKPPDDYRLTRKAVMESGIRCMQSGPFNKGGTEAERLAHKKEAEEIIEFMERVLAKSGVSENDTHLPPSLNPKYCGSNPRTDLNAAYDECHEAICGAVEGLLCKTGLQPNDVDILITTCSIYCPTPSMASMIVNHFKMRPDIQSYHLGGMGCSNGVGAISLVRDLLKARPNSNVVFVTIEVTTPAFYAGKDKARLVPNMLFRMGSAAALFSNKPHWILSGRAKYTLVKNVRINSAARDNSYRCIWYGPDDEGINGVALSKDVVEEASRALTKAMQGAAPHVMTYGQIWAFIRTQLERRMAKRLGRPVPPTYSPHFSEGVQHFLLHAGGAKVLEGLGKALHLTERDLEPSRAVLHDYGNVSSSTTWYTLGFIETMRGVKAGDKVLQVGVGSGVKCGVNVWKAIRDIDDVHRAWERRVQPERQAAVASLTRSRRVEWKHQARQLLSPYAVPQVLSVLLVLAVLVLVVWVFLGGHGGHKRILQALQFPEFGHRLGWTSTAGWASAAE